MTAPAAAVAAVPPATAACDTFTLPPSVELQEGLEPIVRWALRYSPTFRRQCRVLASVPAMRASVRVVPRAGRVTRARALLRHQPGGDVIAEIEISNPSDMIELLAHEFEHLIEQLDGVNLGSMAEQGLARRLEDGAFETARAVSTGQRVAGEVVDNAPDRVRGAGASVWQALKRTVKIW